VRATGPLLLISLLLAACGPAAQPSLTPSSTPTAAPSPAPTVASQFLEIPVHRTGRGKALAAGTYASPNWFDIQFTINVTDGWRVVHFPDLEVLGIASGKNSLGDVSNWLTFLPIYDADAAEFVAAMQAAPELTALAEPLSVTLAGRYEGMQYDFRALPNPGFAGDPEAGIPAGAQQLPALQAYTPGFAWTTSSDEPLIRVFVFDFDGRTMVLYIEAPADEFDAFLIGIHPMLESLSPR